MSADDVAPGRAAGTASGPAAPEFVVVGVGADGWAGLTIPAQNELTRASVIYGSPRQIDLLPLLSADTRTWRSPMSAHLSEVLASPRGDHPIHILASGDPMFHGVGSSIVRAVGRDRVRVLPAVSSASLACALLGWDLARVEVVSLVTAEPEAIAPRLADGRDLLILSRDAATPAAVAAVLRSNGFGWSSMSVLEQLGGDRQRVVEGVARSWAHPVGDALNVIAIGCVGPRAGVMPGLDDDAFRHDGQITKQAFRALSVSALRPGGPQVLWDIGSGSGSVGIEWARADQHGRVIAFEASDERRDMLRDNSRRHGVDNRVSVRGAAPEAFDEAPDPDTVFIGGGLTDEVFDGAWSALLEGGRLVVNAVTLETQALVIDGYHRHGGMLRRIGIETAAALGTMTTWRPALPIVQWVVDKPVDTSDSESGTNR
ncbi:bifunctional cobalt-precorrin-7 (C(5))-methyltransferase/cobalt-precorrin-6B (C(15))-methyltransferase [Gordonia soli]|uniref:Precorrin-6Y C5,15-methyltransferase n=1 Tax=Gordonia soli NBRC 108243 TaxID=1223545 RepID=M0QNN2_9ACTN|nr:bifunctional cobalt-precorrin-7 (C(5))-methyltransferase/cobalt-precorrin-6B (C(15))-methyltransferase [Gordonia soli]GAC70275.1 precorrin-6Y C5,15-methyltransferase [Gordonia soli NBRC 108243]